MALWKPRSDAIAATEFIGRRLFERQKLKGAVDQQGQEGRFELFHFEEKRGEGDVSVERLGQTGIDGRVRNYLLPRATNAAARFKTPQSFVGWAVIVARELQTARHPLQVSPSPIPSDGTEFSDNDFHADIKRLPRHDEFSMAVYLQHLFQKKPHLERAIKPPKEDGPPEPFVTASAVSVPSGSSPVPTGSAQLAPSQLVAFPVATVASQAPTSTKRSLWSRFKALVSRLLRR